MKIKEQNKNKSKLKVKKTPISSKELLNLAYNEKL